MTAGQRWRGRTAARHWPRSGHRAASRRDGVVGNRPRRQADTFPKLLIHNAQTRGAASPCATRISASGRPGPGPQMLDEVRAFSVGLAGARAQARRQVRHHRRATGRGSTGRCAPARRSAPCRCRSMRTRSPTRWPMCWSTPRSTRRGRRRPGAGRQGAVDRRSRCRTLRHMVYDEPRGLRDYDRAQARLDRRRAEASAARSSRRSRRGSRAGKPASPQGKGARPRGHPLHLGHHRAAEGRDAHLRQHASSRRATAIVFDKLDENEEVIAYLPLAWVGDHLFSYAQHYVAGYCVNCPEAGETVVRGPARDRHDLRVRAAARLREPADADHGAHGGRRRAQAQDVPLLHRVTRASGARRSSNKEPVPLDARGCSTGSAMCWSTAR